MIAANMDTVFGDLIGTHQRALAEIEAKRQILELHDHDTVDFCTWELKGGLCSTLRLLALPYADRSGYRDEWRP